MTDYVREIGHCDVVRPKPAGIPTTSARLALRRDGDVLVIEIEASTIGSQVAVRIGDETIYSLPGDSIRVV